MQFYYCNYAVKIFEGFIFYIGPIYIYTHTYTHTHKQTHTNTHTHIDAPFD